MAKGQAPVRFSQGGPSVTKAGLEEGNFRTINGPSRSPKAHTGGRGEGEGEAQKAARGVRLKDRAAECHGSRGVRPGECAAARGSGTERALVGPGAYSVGGVLIKRDYKYKLDRVSEGPATEPHSHGKLAPHLSASLAHTPSPVLV